MTLHGFINSTLNRLGALKKPAPLRRFMAHNCRVFPTATGQAEREPVVLFEFNSLQSSHIACSYLANILAANEQARIEAYLPAPLEGRWRKWLFPIKRALGYEPFGAYQSFGTTGFFYIAPTPAQKKRAKEIFAEVLPRLETKWDVEALAIDGTRIGDLIYDSYLADFRRPTVDKDSQEFQDFLLQSIESFVFWNDYLETHDVRAVNVSHCVYNVAIPLRLAVRRGIPVYQANITHVYRLTPEHLFAYNDFIEFRERFAQLPPSVQKAGVVEAQRRIERRLGGEVGVDMFYSKQSAYGASRHSQLLRESPRKKILIATHCFFDSPHSYGDNIFPDFYEWMDFLGKMTEITDYDWYIKTHPDYLPGTKEIIENFIARYPRFTLLPSDASHHQIIAEGISAVLTVYGTIGFEYAMLGIPVINASQVNPHVAYDFNLHAKDVDDYRRMLSDLDNQDIKIDKNKIYEYYFMRYIYNTDDIFFTNYADLEKSLGGYYGQFAPVVYDKWLEDWSPERHEMIVATLRDFIRSGDFRMDYTHGGRDFTVESMGGQAA